MSKWLRHHYAHLKRWREYAEAVARAASDLLGEVKVYVIGSVARGRYTALSDIDVLIVVPRDKVKRSLVREIMLRAIDAYSLPEDAPVELHIVEEGEEQNYLRDGYIPIKTNNKGEDQETEAQREH